MLENPLKLKQLDQTELDVFIKDKAFENNLEEVPDTKSAQRNLDTYSSGYSLLELTANHEIQVGDPSQYHVTANENLEITLPNHANLSNGEILLFHNVGDNGFDVLNQSEETIATVLPGWFLSVYTRAAGYEVESRPPNFIFHASIDVDATSAASHNILTIPLGKRFVLNELTVEALEVNNVDIVEEPVFKLYSASDVSLKIVEGENLPIETSQPYTNKYKKFQPQLNADAPLENQTLDFEITSVASGAGTTVCDLRVHVFGTFVNG